LKSAIACSRKKFMHARYAQRYGVPRPTEIILDALKDIFSAQLLGGDRKSMRESRIHQQNRLPTGPTQ
jgi:hypothetical protein